MLYIFNKYKHTPGPFTLIKKSTHKKVGGFNENAILLEDFDYGIRVSKTGAKYHLLLREYIKHSPRRVRGYKWGMLEMLLIWYRMFLYYKKHGVITDSKKFQYKYGHF